MTKYLKEIINDEVFMQALILNGVIEMRELVQEVIAKGEAYYIYKVAKIIDSLPDK